MSEGCSDQYHAEPREQGVVVDGGERGRVEAEGKDERARVRARARDQNSGSYEQDADQEIPFTEFCDERENENRCSNQMENAKADVDIWDLPIRDEGNEHPTAEYEEAATEILEGVGGGG